MSRVRGREASVKLSVKGNGNRVSITVHGRGNGEARRNKGLVFRKGNAKLRGIHTFSLPAGWSCPFAQDCQSRADRETGHITDGTDTKYRCFAASQEAMYPSVRSARWTNFELLRRKSREEMAALILASLPARALIVRVHAAGDFFSEAYFLAWLDVARQRPDVRFYFYTKSIRYWVAHLQDVGDGHTPGTVPNFVPTASRGGREDHLIDEHGLRSATVVFSEDEAAEKGLPLDHDDSCAMYHGGDFALLIHGVQPSGTPAAKAVSSLRAEGFYGYGELADKKRIEHGRMPLNVVQ